MRPDDARMAAARAGVPDPGRAVLLGFAGDGEAVAGVGSTARGEEARDGGAAATTSGLAEAWAGHHHLILRCGPDFRPVDAAEGLASAGVPAETPALLAFGLGTGRERLLYGSVEDVGIAGLGEEAVLVVPHPAALPMDFAWPPTAAPEEGSRR